MEQEGLPPPVDHDRIAGERGAVLEGRTQPPPSPSAAGAADPFRAHAAKFRWRRNPASRERRRKVTAWFPWSRAASRRLPWDDESAEPLECHRPRPERSGPRRTHLAAAAAGASGCKLGRIRLAVP